MAVQEQTPVQAVESPAIAIGQASSIQSGGEAMQRDDRTSRSDSFMERLLNNLRLALSVPHT
jgi:hypothetical protein